MRKALSISKYNLSIEKRIFDLTFSFFILLFSLPFFIIFFIAILMFSGRPVFFIQKRVGKDEKIFKIIKFRTMVRGAEKIQNRYIKLNNADGPVFKIYKDPRFTKIGYKLSMSGLDELPQFINVLLGNMSVVGPRPLPVKEFKMLPEVYKSRSKIKPGITSSWVTHGSHQIKFKQWMILDQEYVKKATFTVDLAIILKTIKVILHI